MDVLNAAAGRALAAGDPLTALKYVALRGDPPALALRGIAMAQLGDFARAKLLLRRAARGFGPNEATARARCIVAEAEVALVSRDLGGPLRRLHDARRTLAAHGDRANALHAGYLEARRLLLIGRIDDAERTLDTLPVARMPPASCVGCWLVAAGIAARRIRAEPAHAALTRARRAARATGIPSLMAEVEHATRVLQAPLARLVTHDGSRLLDLAEVEALFATNSLLVDACRNDVRADAHVIRLGSRPVLFELARVLAEAWPGDVPRDTLLARVFRARRIDDSHRARLRVETGRLRKLLRPLAGVDATARGYVLQPHSATTVVVLAPPVEQGHAGIMGLLADNAAWSSSALAQALAVSPRTVQRALEALAAAGQVEATGRGRARRWMAANVPGFPTALLLPAPPAHG
ncbi:MAG: HTH domain-containing protein [Rhodanobacteraceae bacterium]|nr:MAG: HTH domain-containing protein [Rhodanobacteraceae bacterium]